MELKSISKNCYYSTHEDYGYRPSLGYIRASNNYTIMVDAGNSEAHMQEFLALLASKALPMPNICLITHSHWDHTFGMKDFLKYSDNRCNKNAKIYASKLFPIPFVTFNEITEDIEANKELLDKILYISNTNVSFESAAKLGKLSNDEIFNITKISEEYNNLFSAIKISKPITSIRTNALFNHSITVEFSLIENPHSRNAGIVYVHQDKILYGGDCLYKSLDAYNDESEKEFTLEKYKKLEDKLSDIDFKYFIPSHGSPLTREETFETIKDSINALVNI